MRTGPASRSGPPGPCHSTDRFPPRLGGNASAALVFALKDVLADAATSAPPGIEIHPVYDQGLLVRTAIDNVRDAIALGGLMASLIPFSMFLKTRATLIAALSIPLSLDHQLRVPAHDRDERPT